MVNGYFPNQPETLAWVGLALLVELVAGFFITRLQNSIVARAVAWLLVVVAVVGIERLTAS